MSVVAWLHNNSPSAFVITEKVKQIWLETKPDIVENYTEPLVLASELTSLRQKLASAQQEIAQTRALLCDANDSYEAVVDKLEESDNKLAAAQAVNAKLREALKHISSGEVGIHLAEKLAKAALALPHDTTELREVCLQVATQVWQEWDEAMAKPELNRIVDKNIGG